MKTYILLLSVLAYFCANFFMLGYYVADTFKYLKKGSFERKWGWFVCFITIYLGVIGYLVYELVFWIIAIAGFINKTLLISLYFNWYFTNNFDVISKEHYDRVVSLENNKNILYMTFKQMIINRYKQQNNISDEKA